MGDIIFIPHNTKYRTHSVTDCSGIGILFDFLGDLSIKPGLYMSWIDTSGEYLRLFERICKCQKVSPKALLHQQSLVYRILDHMTTDISENEKMIKMLEPAIEILTTRYRENLSLKDYADPCNLSVSYFRHMFKKQLGMSPIEYRNRLRFEEVRRLRHQGCTVNQIAEICGFCDAAYLRRLFKRETGETIRDCNNIEDV